MATKTTNYGLEKPDGTDFYDVDVQNSNMDIIDKQMKANANAITQLNSDTKSIIQFLGNMTTPNNSEGIIHANWPDNMVPVAIRVKKYDQWRYNVLGMALYGKELYLIEIPSAYQGCPCEVICYKSN
ncbi:hypothetical protein [Anaerostipes hadrus]|uniref:Uncharacterized protein n=4 Tax=Anaerostipes hadrus TaxID=649756 RepID=A0A1Q2C8K8_ANAHA|nr:hypothetical protein [Anaerostipes hadrus]AQP39899.1 hypothetical protein DO83_10095 [Anaerostipes hadrus]NSG58728.1 hypothetical protein [Anaerostipes hadrus]